MIKGQLEQLEGKSEQGGGGDILPRADNSPGLKALSKC